MGLKSDRWIIEQCEQHQLIEPYVREIIKQRNGQKIISFGTSSYGYDIRLADEFKIFHNVNTTVVDPKAFTEANCIDYKGDICIIPPNSFVLARSLEYVKMPSNVTAIVTNKSTYARTGVVSPITVLEAGWHGFITLEFSNTTPLPAKLYAHEGALQLLFFEGDEQCLTDYAKRAGKYHNAQALELPKL